MNTCINSKKDIFVMLTISISQYISLTLYMIVSKKDNPNYYIMTLRSYYSVTITNIMITILMSIGVKDTHYLIKAMVILLFNYSITLVKILSYTFVN